MDNEKLIYQQISDIARKYDTDKVVLFGSRSRKTNDWKSDIDLAIYGCKHFRDLYFDINENVDTLLTFDIINMDRNDISSLLIKEIERDGIIIYEKI